MLGFAHCGPHSSAQCVAAGISERIRSCHVMRSFLCTRMCGGGCVGGVNGHSVPAGKPPTHTVLATLCVCVGFCASAKCTSLRWTVLGVANGCGLGVRTFGWCSLLCALAKTSCYCEYIPCDFSSLICDNPTSCEMKTIRVCCISGDRDPALRALHTTDWDPYS